MEHKQASSRSDDTHKTATDSSLKKSAIKVKIQNGIFLVILNHSGIKEGRWVALSVVGLMAWVWERNRI